jgi:hypothetical protein
MEKFKSYQRLSLAFLATAALSFSQVAGPQYPPAYPNNASQPPAANHEMAQPGTINYVEGQVSLNNQTLGPQGSATLQPGNILSTGSGFAEVLLTPGVFLRVGNNSEIRLGNAGLAGAQVQLDHGVANVEVDQLITGTHLAVNMNAATIEVEKKGLYDFNADQQSVKVLDGKLNVEAAAGTKAIGKGDQLLLASEKPLKVQGFNMKAEEAQPLYVWSEARSRDESQANVAIAQNVGAYGGWYGSGWYWDPYWSSYAFLPGSGFLYSPFGWGFYSPAFIGYYGVPYGYGRFGYARGHVYGVGASVSGYHSVGSGFHSAGGGGFHGGGGGGHR